MSTVPFAETIAAVVATCAPVEFVALFGSQATGRARPDSDVDVAVRPVSPDWSLADELALQSELTRALGREVDLVRLDGSDPYLEQRIAHEGRVVTEARPKAFLTWAVGASLAWLEIEPFVTRATARMLATAHAPGLPSR